METHAPRLIADRLAGRVAVVTGAGSTGDEIAGVGYAIAARLSEQGARIAAVDLNRERADITCADITSRGAKAEAYIGDVADEGDCKNILEAINASMGPPQILVNNAAIVTANAGVYGSRAEWDRTMAVNLTSVFLMSKYALPFMTDRGGGSIINISSIAAVASMGAGAYAASKAGVIALTREIAYAAGCYGVRANCVVPGYIYAPMSAAGGANARELHRRAVLLNREGSGWDVADAVAFLSSDEARWITGIALPVDGGTTATTISENWPWASEFSEALRSFRPR
jgi:NAD(P)-dependent dehydrogenase (short-subunit alcohol dehydrogenase family)